jgi:hypothetical protein
MHCKGAQHREDVRHEKTAHVSDDRTEQVIEEQEP